MKTLKISNSLEYLPNPTVMAGSFYNVVSASYLGGRYFEEKRTQLLDSGAMPTKEKIMLDRDSFAITLAVANEREDIKRIVPEDDLYESFKYREFKERAGIRGDSSHYSLTLSSFWEDKMEESDVMFISVPGVVDSAAASSPVVGILINQTSGAIAYIYEDVIQSAADFSNLLWAVAFPHRLMLVTNDKKLGYASREFGSYYPESKMYWGDYIKQLN